MSWAFLNLFSITTLVILIISIILLLTTREQRMNLVSKEGKIGQFHLSISSFFTRKWPRLLSWLTPKMTKDNLSTLIEIVLITGWAIIITTPYQDFNPNVWPTGMDFSRNIQLFSTWQNLPVCGDCVFWNGSINGGAPAFGDMFTPVLNPFFIIFTLFFGVINGSKLLLITSFILAGLAQLWLGRILGFSWITRVWTAAMVVAGGHLSTRMQMGHIVMVIPIAAGSLLLASAFDLARTGRRRSVVIMAMAMSLALVSGHGYTQISILLGLLPALLLYVFDGQLRVRPLWRSFLWAMILTILITAIFWIPLFNFSPNIQKAGDPYFSGGQPMAYGVLNLVIGDRGFLQSDVLGKWGAPAMYGMFIGWIPIILVFFAAHFVPRKELRTFYALLLAIFLIYFVSSGQLFKWSPEVIQNFFTSARNLALIQPLAIPMILALAGWGLDGLFKLPWPKLSISLDDLTIRISMVFLLIIPLYLGLKSEYKYSIDWIQTNIVSNEDYPLNTFSPKEARWIAMPYGEFNPFPKGIEANLKMIIYRDFTAWNWTDREVPKPEIELTRDESFMTDPAFTRMVGPYLVLEHPEINYAYVVTEDGSNERCTAKATGGHIDVTCETDQAGTLYVSENNYPGWKAKVNGKSVRLLRGDLISMALPAGSNEIQLRYLPADVFIGGLLTMIGFLLCVYIWRNPMIGLPESVPLEELETEITEE